MKINVTKEWCEQSAEIEGNSEIGAGCPPRSCSVVVTRYPTGLFGIAYAGAMFWKTCWKESEVHRAITSLNIHADQVKWLERYCYNGRYLISSDYRLREYIPQKGN